MQLDHEHGDPSLSTLQHDRRGSQKFRRLSKNLTHDLTDEWVIHSNQPVGILA